MKIPTWKNLLLGACLVVGLTAQLSAQDYSITWSKVAGGGGVSSNGPYTLAVTIGQPDASAAMTGCGGYSEEGGFLSFNVTNGPTGSASAVPLTIAYSYSGNAVVISWPENGCFTLQQNSNLAAVNNWVNVDTTTYPITTANGVNSITISPPTGTLFFRLFEPGP
jgi:hypothetical protein